MVLPIDHIYNTTSSKKDSEVLLQGLEIDYNYQTICTRDAIKKDACYLGSPSHCVSV